MFDTASGALPLVLVALDGSPAAAAGIPAGRAVAAQLGAALEFLYVTAAPVDASEARTRLGLDIAALRGETLRVVVGDAAEEILRRAADPRVALVVLTTHGREPQSGPRLGSVAREVVARTEDPILLIRPEARDDPRREPGLHRLLLPLDGTPATASVLQPATRLCSRLHASIDLLYVADPEQAPPGEPGSIGAPQYVDQPHYEWQQWADEVLERLLSGCAGCPQDVPVRAFLARGRTADEIVRFAAAHRHDAIVVARRSHLEPGRAVTLRSILDRAPCPILLVGASRDAPEVAWREVAERVLEAPMVVR